jgi:2-methylcitrate dehydratase PrpD
MMPAHTSATTAQAAAPALGAFVSAVRYEDLPPEQQVRAKMRLLDALLCAFAGRESEPSRLARGFAQRRASQGPGTFWLTGVRGSLEDCVFANSILVHGALLDDGPVHTACVVVPTALAVGESEGRTGAEILAAIAVGYETTLRVDSGGLAHDAMKRGFRHSWPVVFGGAATAAYLMGLPGTGIKDALGLAAAACNPGTMEPMGKQGTSERYVQMAVNAKQGVLAADLARAGFAGIDTALDGDAGVYHAYTGHSEAPAGLLDGIGETWHLDDVRVKPYPCSGVGTLTIYCAARLASEHAIEHEDVAGVELKLRDPGHMMGAVGDTGPFVNFEQALVSNCFQVAATLVFGRYDVDVVRQALGDPRVDALASRIEAIGVDDLPASEQAVTVTLADGTALTATAASMPAELLDPPDWDAMVARFHALAPSVPEERRELVVREVLGLDESRDVRALLDLLGSGHPGAAL